MSRIFALREEAGVSTWVGVTLAKRLSFPIVTDMALLKGISGRKSSWKGSDFELAVW